MDLMAELNSSVGRDIAALFDDKAIQKTMEKTAEFQMIDSAP